MRFAAAAYQRISGEEIGLLVQSLKGMFLAARRRKVRIDHVLQCADALMPSRSRQHAAVPGVAQEQSNERGGAAPDTGPAGQNAVQMRSDAGRGECHSIVRLLSGLALLGLFEDGGEASEVLITDLLQALRGFLSLVSTRMFRSFCQLAFWRRSMTARAAFQSRGAAFWMHSSDLCSCLASAAQRRPGTSGIAAGRSLASSRSQVATD